MTEVRLSGLTVAYPGAGAPAVDGVDLTLPSGSLTALLGPSGCGKTSVMRAIAGLLAPASGDVAFDGLSVLRVRAEDRGAVMVFQNHLLFPWMDVAANVGFGLRMRGLARGDIAARVAGMLDRVRLTGLADRRPAELSGGQAQRVALARALVTGPRVLLLDEPLSNLDAHLRGEMRDLIARLQRETGITTLFVTHDQQEAVTLADTIALMGEGRLRQVGPPAAFYDRPADAGVARFFGAENFVAGRVTGGAFDGPLGRLSLPAGLAEGDVLLTIRPEAVVVGAAEGAPNALSARIEERRYLGTQVRLVLRCGAARLVAMSPPRSAAGLEVGQAVTIALPPAALWVLPAPTGGEWSATAR